ncbi:MAG TPA: NAD-dependent epimerase/dehydratase family protein [Gallionellaceae bacterium]|nr:NAD-dependent epimerase/dehydratase family protein [Gallionellaceae bacterium]
MKILICGASGFVGRHLTQALRGAGHTVTRAVRTPREPGDIAADFRSDTSKKAWLPRVAGIDAVINAVGVLRDGEATPMQRLHAETPAALFAACAEAGVRRIVHVSALGVESGVNVPYFATKLAAEQALNALPPNVRRLCLRPSVIYGEDGASAKMFRNQARMPVLVLPMGGHQQLQPVHIDDICTAVVRWLGDADAASQTVSAVGAEPTTMRGMLDSYREQMGHGAALHVTMPAFAMRLAARIGDHIPASPLCSDTLAMLAAGNTAPAEEFARLLGHAPRSYRAFIA